jgi:monooxygenase
VIGSGATAVTLVPALAQTAEHVTMLQRSPTYVLPMPAEDAVARDVVTLRYGKIDDGTMRFSRLPRAQAASRVTSPVGKYREAG